MTEHPDGGPTLCVVKVNGVVSLSNLLVFIRKVTGPTITMYREDECNLTGLIQYTGMVHNSKYTGLPLSLTVITYEHYSRCIHF